MSIEDQDPFLQIVSYEEATEEQLMILEGIALDLLLEEPAERIKAYTHAIPETGATIRFSQTHYEDPAGSGMFTSVRLYREFGKNAFGSDLICNHNDQAAKMYCPSAEDMYAALKVVQELIQSGRLNDEESFVAHYVEELLLSICLDGEATDDVVAVAVPVQIPETIRKLTENKNGENAMIIREFGSSVGSESNVTIIHHELEGEADLDDVEADELIIIYEDRIRNLHYEYSIDFEGERSLEVTRGNEEYEPEEGVVVEETTDSVGDDYEHQDPIEEELKKLWNNTPAKNDVELLTDILISVTGQYLDPSDLE